MQRTSRAPELSATLSRLSCWIIYFPVARSLRPLEDFDDPPALLAGEGARLRHPHAVTLPDVVGLVVGVQARRALEGLPVPAVPDAVDHRDHDGLVHLGGQHH